VGPMLEDSPIDIHLLGELASGVLTDADRDELTWWIEARSKLRGGKVIGCGQDQARAGDFEGKRCRCIKSWRS
jgi:hypothetical protein